MNKAFDPYVIHTEMTDPAVAMTRFRARMDSAGGTVDDLILEERKRCLAIIDKYRGFREGIDMVLDKIRREMVKNA